MREHLKQDRWLRQSWLRRLVLTSPLAALVGWVACDPGDGCCNTCSRNYYLGRTDDAQVWIENIQESGNECVIDDLPQEVPEGVSTFVAVASAFDGVVSRVSDRIVVEAHATGNVSSELCNGLEVHDAATFLAANIAPGTRVCLVDHAASEVLCTQKGCPDALSCRVHTGAI